LIRIVLSRVIPMHRQVDAHSPIPIRRQLTEPRKDVSEGDSVPRETRPCRAPGSWSGSSASIRMRVHAIEELKRRGYRLLSP
jgi:hypothetical protein